MPSNKILIINPGSTSTKIAVYKGYNSIFLKNITHEREQLYKLNSIESQLIFRKDIIISELKKAEITISGLDIIIARGGLLKPIESGVYEVNDAMLSDLQNTSRHHASNLGALIAYEISKEKKGLKSFIADPVVVDEMQEIAKFSGHPKFTRTSVFHALNQKAVANIYSQSLGIKYSNLNLIVAHMGGGISIGAHEKGRVIDVNQALDGSGPFSPERSGTLPMGDVIKAAFSGEYTEKEMLEMIVGKGGLVAYLGTSNAYEIEQNAKNGDEKSNIIYKAMAYQISKEIGAMATVIKGKVDAIILTGGLAKSEYLNNMIKESVGFISKIIIYPGEDEMQSLAINANLLLEGKIKEKKYS